MKVIGKIFVVRAPGVKEVYYGSTLRDLNELLRSYTMQKVWRQRHPVFAHPEAYIELVEEYPHLHEWELRRRVGEWVKRDKNADNGNIPGRTIEEYAKEKRIPRG